MDLFAVCEVPVWLLLMLSVGFMIAFGSACYWKAVVDNCCNK